jgi:hypothetical protein
MKDFKYPFRVGRKQNRAVLDANGIQVVVFEVGAEELAQLTCDLLNKHNQVSNVSPERIEIDRRYLAIIEKSKNKKWGWF